MSEKMVIFLQSEQKEGGGMEIVICISTVFTALATIVIALYAWKNHKLTSAIQSKDDEFKKQIEKMLKGISISNILSSTYAQSGEHRAEKVLELFEKKFSEVLSRLD